MEGLIQWFHQRSIWQQEVARRLLEQDTLTSESSVIVGRFKQKVKLKSWSKLS